MADEIYDSFFNDFRHWLIIAQYNVGGCINLNSTQLEIYDNLHFV